MENKKVIGDSQHGFTGGKLCCQPWAEEPLLLLLGAVVPVTNFLGGCTQPFLQQNAQFATFFSTSWIFFFFEDFNPFIWKLVLEGRGNELLAECGILLHGELQMNGALSAGISVENTP